MPRKGSHKVRSGCMTCKARRVKCDESKPSCKRCIKAGRTCDGYGLDRIPQLQLYQPQNRLLGNTAENESRAIEFFCKVVAPSLSGPTDPYFWTDIVMQFSEMEPAVRHSIITVSSLFENLQHRGNPSARTTTQRNVIALKHYNAAIRELQKPNNPALVLMTCILFVCIEMLQSNGDVAIRHCYHGLTLLGASDTPEWVLHYLSPIFRRLSILPFYFGDSQPLTDYSHLTQPNPSITDWFSSFFQAQASMDAIYNLTIQLFRRTGDYRLGQARNQAVEPAILLEQGTIHRHLTQWRSSFDKFESRTYMDVKKASEASRIWMFQQYEVCTILSNLLFVTDETDYDRYIPNFKRMVKGARKLADERKRSMRTDFHFEMGFSPFLFLVAIKCRCLETRIEALRLMNILGAAQESLWDTHALQVIAQRVIDLEHGVVAQGEGKTSTPKYNSLPPDEVRVRHFVLGSSESGSQENRVAGKEITFYMPTEGGGLKLRRELLSTEKVSEALAAAPGIFSIDLGRGSQSPAKRADSEGIYTARQLIYI